jgi:menaquinone-dependent protoporphyrinogen oxidase
MSVLVVYASKHGATGQIAERIAEGLRAAGQAAEARPVQGVGDLSDYEGFVIGSASYSTHWLKDATVFVRNNRELLAQRPVWLFSSGPLGTAAPDAGALDLSEGFEPREIRELQAAIHPRDHRIFCGALDPGRLSPAELWCLRRPATRALLPEGDFRDWARIRRWAEGIAQEMAQREPPATQRTARRRWVGRPVVPCSMRRTGRLNTVGTTFVVVGLLAVLLGAPLALMLAWSSSGALIVGVEASVLVGGLGVLLLAANWLVLGLSERTPAERAQARRERDDYEAATKEYGRTRD